jgi:hypothetical protein
MAGSMQQILMPITLTKVISRIAATTDSVLQLFRFEQGGKNTLFMGHGREGSYQVYNNVRNVAQGRAPGTAHGRRKRQGIGRVPFVYPRMADSVELLAEEIHNIAQIGDPRTRDIAGKDYIRRQTKSLGQAAGNWRTALTVGMLRGSLYFDLSDGENWFPTYTAPSVGLQMPMQMPDGNKLRLNMLGGGNIVDATWLLPTTNIPLHWSNIKSAMAQLCGGHLVGSLCGSAMWSYILQNDYVREYAGTSAPPYKEWVFEGGQGEDGKPMTEMRGSVAAFPGVTFHINDNGLDIGVPGSTTFTKHVADTSIAFFCDPTDPDLYTMYEGSEPVAEYDGGPKTVKQGFAAWSCETANPTTTSIYVLDNCLPVNHVPASLIYATPVF